MNSAKKHIECFEDFRCKVIEHLKSFVPDDYVIAMRRAHSFRLLVEQLFDPDTLIPNKLKKYDVEWVDSANPCYFHTVPKTVIRNPLSVARNPRAENCSDKQIVQNISLKFTGWD